MSCRTGCASILIIGAAGIVAATPHTSIAQTRPTMDDGPIIINRPRPRESLRLEPMDVTLDLTAVYQRSESDRGGAKTDSQQWLFTQELTLETRGYVVHPNLLELNIAFGGGIEEALGDFSGDSDTSISPIYDWDLSATYRRNGEWPLTVYSRREQYWIFRDFANAVEADTTETGASVSHHQGSTDTQLSLTHVESNQSGQELFDDYNFTQDSFNWFSSAQLGPGQSLTWSYNVAAVDQSGAANASYTTHDLSLSHMASFGQGQKDRLTSRITYNRSDASLGIDRFRWTERLNLKHSSALRTRYEYNLEWYQIGQTERMIHRGSGGFTHQLYKSLTTNGDIGVNYASGNDDFTSTTYYGDISWDYRKKVPYGILNGSLGLGFSRDENSASGTIEYADLSRTFTDPQPIVLIGTGINPSTIVLTDPSGLLYVPGVDYTVQAFADRVEIQRIIGGAIGSGQTVLIDYAADPQPQSTIDTANGYAGLRYDIDRGFLSGLSLYARYSQQNQSIDSPQPESLVENEYDDVLYGAEYRRWGWTFGLEQQLHDSTVYPYDATRFFARYLRRAGATDWSLNAAWTRLEYGDLDNTVDLYTVSGRVDHRITSRLRASAVLMWRDESSTLYGDVTGFEQQLELEWNYRQVEAYVQVRASQLDTDLEETNFEFIRLGVRRKF